MSCVMLTRSFAKAAIKRSPLYDFYKNIEHSPPTMGNFEGYEMPAYFGDPWNEHLQCKKRTGVFDISHMGQLRIHGKDRIEFMNYLTISDLNKIPVGDCLQSLLMMPTGGIKDEITIQKFDKYIGLVVSAGCREKDMDYLLNYMNEFRSKGKDVIVEELHDQALISVNGPMASGFMDEQVDCRIGSTRYMQCRESKLWDVPNSPITLMRSGYTGEDGFDISVSKKSGLQWLQRILHGGKNLKACGLDAWNSLRLEAGKTNYFNDMDENLTPLDADYEHWIPSSKWSSGGWLGYEAVCAQSRTIYELQKYDGMRLRVGFSADKDGPSARRGSHIWVTLDIDPEDEDQGPNGIVTSGAYSPSLKKGVGMALLRRPRAPIVNFVYKAKLKKHKALKVKIANGPLSPTNYYD